MYLAMEFLDASFRSGRPEVFCKKNVLRNFSKSIENTCARVSFLINLQASGICVFGEYYEISENKFSYRTPPVVASDLCLKIVSFRMLS